MKPNGDPVLFVVLFGFDMVYCYLFFWYKFVATKANLVQVVLVMTFPHGVQCSKALVPHLSHSSDLSTHLFDSYQ